MLIFILEPYLLFPQIKIPYENKNWRWLLPENNKIYSLAIDADTVWAGSDVGFFKLNINTGDVINYNKINSPLPDNWILALAVDDNHNKWIGTHEKGVVKINGDEWKIFEPKYFGIYRMEIRDLKVENEFLWISTWGDGLIKMNMVDNSYEIFTSENSGILYDAIYNIEIDSRGTKWIATMLGVCKFDDKSWAQVSSTSEDFSQMINSISIDNAGNIWALYDRGARISRYDGKEWKDLFIPRSLFKYGLCHSNMIYEDNKNNIWVSTTDGFLKFDGDKWTIINQESSGYDMDFVECVRIDKNNRLWVGGWDGLFCLHEGEWEKYSTGNTPIPGIDIQSIEIDKAGKMWIGTGSGLATFDGKWEVITNFNFDVNIGNIRKIVIDSSNNIWCANTWRGLLKQSENNDTWILFDTLNSKLPDNYILDMEVDRKGLLWITSRNGLANFDGSVWNIFNRNNSDIPLKTFSEIAVDSSNNLWLAATNFDLKNRGDKLVKFTGSAFDVITPPENFDKLNKSTIQDIYVDEKDVKWIITCDNLIWFDNKNWNSLDKYATQIFFSCLSDIYCDKNFTWVSSTMGGLIRFNGTKFMVWNDDNSFLPDDITTITKDNFGNLWIGTQNQGIILYNPEGILFNAKTN